MTGLAGGAVPRASDIALSLERLRGIEEIDPAAATLSVWAGTTLEEIQQAALNAGFVFPLDLGARGSCQIGGNIATNAGGNAVIRYGMARDLVLGLEVVLADGRVLDLRNKMIKNNCGYDLKQCFIGSEGTLGVITRAVLKLAPQPGQTSTLLCALPDYASAVSLLRRIQRSVGTPQAYELMWQDFFRLGVSWLENATPPCHWTIRCTCCLNRPARRINSKRRWKRRSAPAKCSMRCSPVPRTRLGGFGKSVKPPVSSRPA